MNLHISKFLAAYHDGELTTNHERQVEKHLADCAACRADLESFVKLSSLLKADVVPRRTTPQRFTAQVQLRLPRALSPRTVQRENQIPCWVLGIPIVLIIVWAFLQATLKVILLILTADQALGQYAAFFHSWITSKGLFEASTRIFLLNTILLVGTSILWSAWMAFWLAWQKNQNESSLKGGVM